MVETGLCHTASRGLCQLHRAHRTERQLQDESGLDENRYPTGREVTAQQMENLAIKQDKFHGEWNYTIQPKTQMDNLFWRDALYLLSAPFLAPVA